MSLDRSGLSADEYYATALHIFDYCGIESTGTLRVDALMEKFAPFVKTNKAEFSCLKTLLDPDEENSEISVTMLAKTLHKYSENQKKVDLDESFNLSKSGQVTQDSDSGISTDGFHLLEELQCELKEKAHLAHQLRSQLEFTDRQHEEAIAALTAERDTLKTHLNMLREENINLSDVRRDYEEVCERLCISDRALDDARRELDAFRRRNKVAVEQVASLESEKITLQELLAKSKAECHRINEMYAARQSNLLEQNEALKTEHADLSTRLQDQEEFVQQMIKEKVLLEMELKDMLNKSNQTQLRMDRSIDVSYTDEQMLTALDTLNAESKFSQENQMLNEEAFVNALKEDQGRVTNISLFDEIRLSLCDVSRYNTTGLNSFTDEKHIDSFTCDKFFENSFVAVGTQTENQLSNEDKRYSLILSGSDSDRDEKEKTNIVTVSCQTESILKNYNIKVQNIRSVQTQYESEINADDIAQFFVSNETQTDIELYSYSNKVQSVKIESLVAVKTQTDVIHNSDAATQTVKLNDFNNNSHDKCLNCEKIKTEEAICTKCPIKDKLLEIFDNNLCELQKCLDYENERTDVFKYLTNSLLVNIDKMETACARQNGRLDSLSPDNSAVQKLCDVSSVSTQADIPCLDCEKRKSVASNRSFRRFFWTPLKCLFQIFAMLCFISAIVILYGVTTRARPSCPKDAVPWSWIDAQEIMDLLLRIEYVADVPM